MNPEHTRRDMFAVSALAAGAAVTLSACGGSGDGSGDGSSGGRYGPDDVTGSGEATGSGNGTGEQPLARLDDIAVGKAVSATDQDGNEIIVARPERDTAIAFSATCTHQGCTVAPADAQLECPCHQSTFDLTTGEVRGGPAPRPLPEVPVRVESGQVFPA